MSAGAPRRQRFKHDGQCGGADVLALMVLAPAVIGFAVLLVWLGRQVDTTAQVRSAAAAAAQAAVLERSVDLAERRARSVAAAILEGPAQCAEHQIDVDLGDYRPGGEIIVSVDCSMSNEGLGLLAPPSVRFAARSTARLDQYRSIP